MRNLLSIALLSVPSASVLADQIPEFGSLQWGVTYDEVLAVAGEPVHAIDQIGNVMGASIIYRGGRFAGVPLELTVYEFAPGCILATGQAHTCRFSTGKYTFKIPADNAGKPLPDIARKQYRDIETYLTRQYGPGEKIRGNDHYTERRLAYVNIRHALTFGAQGNSHNLWYVGPHTDTQFENYRIARNEGGARPGSIDQPDSGSDIKALQQTILEGDDPSTSFEATAAGPK